MGNSLAFVDGQFFNERHLYFVYFFHLATTRTRKRKTARDLCLYGHSRERQEGSVEGGVPDDVTEADDEDEEADNKEQPLVLLDCDSTSKFPKRFLYSQILWYHGGGSCDG